jgi:hypothetical protein
LMIGKMLTTAWDAKSPAIDLGAQNSGVGRGRSDESSTAILSR